MQICDATEAQCVHAALLLGRTFKGHDFNWIPEGVKAGHYTASTIKINDVDRYLIAHHASPQGGLVINAVAQLTPSIGDMPGLVCAFKELARKHSCKWIEGITMRAGMLKELMKQGFKPSGVCVELSLA
jgi:hypothetical protein